VKAKTKVYCESPVREFLARATFMKAYWSLGSGIEWV
jgi:hypothetical protein